MKSLNCDGWRGGTLAVACALLLLPEVWGEVARGHLAYERSGIQSGQWWRLISGHLVHLNFRHAVLNVAGLVLLWVLFSRDQSLPRWLGTLLAAVVAIDVGLWLLDPRVSWYVGFSGVLHGFMAAGAFIHVLRREFDGWILAAFLVGKLIYEQTAGPMPFSVDAGPVIVDAHLYGAIGGIVGAMLPGGARSL